MSGDYEIICRRNKPGRFVALQEIDFRVRMPDGALTDKQTHEVLVPKDAVAILAYRRDLDQVVLINQFRVATARNAPGDGWLIEIPAGGIDSGELPLEAARREFNKETRYRLADSDAAADAKQLSRFEHIGTIYPTPGLSTERIYLYYVELDEKDGQSIAADAAGEPEEIIHVKHVPTDTLFAGLDKGEYADAKLIAAAQWFRNVGYKRSTGHPQTGDEEFTFVFIKDRTKKSCEQRRISVKRGNIRDVHGIDIWVNSENTDMLMDRFFGRSVSATIRYLGAEKLDNGTIYRDSIADALRARLGGEIFVRPGDVVVTEPGELRRAPYRVRKIFHAASVYGRPGQGISGTAVISAACVERALQEAQGLNRGRWRWTAPFRSMVIPMLGAGQGGEHHSKIAPNMVSAALDHMKRHPDDELVHITFIAVDRPHFNSFRDELQKRTDLIERAGSGPQS